MGHLFLFYCLKTNKQTQWRHLDVLSLQYLILPRDGDAACDKLVVEVVVSGVEVHAFDGRELLNVQDVFTVHGSRLPHRGTDSHEKEKKKNLSKLVKSLLK